MSPLLDRRAVCLFLLLFGVVTSHPAWAITVRTVGPFDVVFHGNGDTYTDSNSIPYTGAKNWTTTEMDDVRP